MTVLSLTLAGSFNNVPFLVDSMSTSGGIKSVKHVYPNSSNQVIEDLGPLQRTYIIDAWINNNPEADDYLIKRDALIAVLESGDRGVLSHPLFGRLENMSATTFGLQENFGELGVAKFTITFEVGLPQSVPVVAANTRSQVDAGKDTAVTSVTNDVAFSYDVQLTNNILDGIEQANGYVESLRENTSLFAINAEQLDQFNSQVSELSANVVSLVQDPQALATSISNTFETVSGMYATTKATFDVLRQFFDFGDDDIDFPLTTNGWIERKQNRELLNSAVQGYALVYAYETASALDFATVEEQQETADILEEQYDKVIRGQSIPTLSTSADADPELPPVFIDIGLTTDTKSTITDLRISVEKLFDDNAVTLGRIITVRTNETSVRLLTYQYYGNTDLDEDIIALNDIKDASFIAGDVRIVTS